jgi:glyoxylase-like metal-dependent hydrolase (beta-lactamase superfamily II)
MRVVTKKIAMYGGSVVVLVAALLGIAQIRTVRFAALRMILPLTETLSVNPLRGGVYWISGGLSNTGFVIGNNGVIVIDVQMFMPVARRQLADIAKLTSKPVNEIILTHSDPDHINGLPAYPRGIEIIAQEHAAAEMRRVVEDPSSNGFPPPPEIKDYMPTHTVQSREDLILDGVPVVLLHTAPAHTDGDLAIYLPSQKIVFAGDLLTPAVGEYPGIHLEKQGSSRGWFESMKVILALDADVYVPGHGKLLSKDILVSRLKRSEQRWAEIKVLFDQGKTLSEIKATLHDTPLKGIASRFPTFIETTYREFSAEKAGLATRGR